MLAQGLPMKTIVLIVIILVVLASVLIFFFSSFSKTKESTNLQQNFAKCHSICAQVVSSANDKSTCVSKANALGFCDLSCDKVIKCSKEGVWDTISCSGGSASCS